MSGAEAIGLRSVAAASAAATAVVALSGCSFGGEQRQPEWHDAPAQSKVTAAMTQRVVALHHVPTALDTTAPDFAYAHTEAAAAAQGNADVRQQLNTAIDARAEAVAIGNADQASTSDTPFVTPDVSRIQDPARQKQARGISYILGAAKVIDGLQAESYTPAQARQNIASHMPIGGELLRDQAERAVDVTAALAATSAGEDNTAAMRSQIAGLSDPVVRKAASRYTDVLAAKNITDSIDADSISTSQANAALGDIADSTIHRQVAKAIDAAAGGDGNTVADVESELSDEALQQQQALQDLSKQYHKTLAKAQDATSDLSHEETIAVNQADDALGKAFGAASGAHPAPVAELPEIAQPQAMIDLSGVTPQAQVPNAYKASGGISEEGRYNPDSFAQFGEISMQDGKPVFNFQTGGGFTPELRQRFVDAYNASKPFAEAAFASGELITIRFILTDTSDPQYASNTREALIVLGNQQPISEALLAYELRHELAHALSRNAMSMRTLSLGQMDQLAAVCGEMRSAVNQQLQESLQIEPTVVRELQQEVVPAQRPGMKLLADAVQKGTLPAVLDATPGELKGSTTVANSCNGLPNTTNVVARLLDRSNVQYDADKDFKYLPSLKGYRDLDRIWTTAVTTRSVQATVLDESNYDHENPLFGHAEDNLDETYASTVDSSTDWPQGFASKLKSLSPAQNKTTRRLMSICMDILAQHPPLQPFAEKTRSRYGLAS